ncbi:MAG: Ig-like domain-containing protein [Nitrospinota bacterium]|nr:Ig-like domain-containing protein [Nitrospinota bacterium]MDH5679082.1 Ig-like domain-containing protein [Nitrospinota bacterium]MDH5756718.1 Ig-like domain-containing protein [Nitrospinota bacterium]
MMRKIMMAVALAPMMAVVLLSGCSSMEGESTADHRVGPVGPTYPSGYYFDGTVTPHSVVPPSSVVFLVRVYDSNGNLVPNVPVYWGGPDDAGISTTGYDGIAVFMLQIKAAGGGGIMGSVMYNTFTVEDTYLTIPLQIVPSGG